MYYPGADYFQDSWLSAILFFTLLSYSAEHQISSYNACCETASFASN